MDKIKNPITIVSSGGSATLVSKTITANGQYDPADDNADGYSDVTVAVPAPENKFKSLVDGSITSVTADDLSGVTGIRSYSFSYCTSLTSLTVPSSVTSIGSWAFYRCSALTSVTILATTPPTLDNANAFESTNDYPIYVPAASLTAYQQATNWSTLAGRIKAIQDLSFTSNGDGTCYVSGIGTVTDTDITIPSVSPTGDTVTSIGERAFSVCASLTSVTILDSVTSIGMYAFYRCTNLTSVTIPDSVTNIGDRAFYGCTSLTSITVADGNPVYHSSGNCIIETASKTLIAGCNNSVIPTDGSVTSIGEGAFGSCTSLTSVTIPDSVTSIGSWAFWGCTLLISVSIYATIPPSLANSNAFDKTNDCPIYVPVASLTAYQQATNWSALADADRIFAIQE